MIKKLLKPLVPQSVLDLRRRYLERKRFVEWEKNGRPVPPPHVVKQYAIAEYQKKYGYQILVETGTYMGDMVEAEKKRFKKIISIELSQALFEKVQERFRNDKNILIVQGDSGEVLPRIVRDLHEPAIFWLDGHYSGGVTAKGSKECPIFEEIDAILSNNNNHHILLIDDARCFIGDGSYPTVEQLTRHIQRKNGAYEVEVKDDIIRCVSKNLP